MRVAYVERHAAVPAVRRCLMLRWLDIRAVMMLRRRRYFDVIACARQH